MDSLIKELNLPIKNIFPTSTTNLFSVVVHSSWLKKIIKNCEVNNSVNVVDFPLQLGDEVPHPWRKVFIRVIEKKSCKVLPLPRYKIQEGSSETPLTFSKLIHYVSVTNHRNLWKESFKKHSLNPSSSKEGSVVNLLEHDNLLTELILRLYGCNIIKMKSDSTGRYVEYKEIIPNKYVSKAYETHVNLLAALFTIETENNLFIVYRGTYDSNLLDCLNFSPTIIDKSYARGLFILYQLLNISKAMYDRGLSMGNLTLQNIYMSENLWLQVVPPIVNNIHMLDESLINEHNKSSMCEDNSVTSKKEEESLSREHLIELEKLCLLWVKGRISNLDYLLHLNVLAGRSANDPQAHFIVPWVTDFSSRCGKNWRDLTKSKYRLTKGDRQLDLTFEVSGCPDQIPHHVSDVLADITCYVYLARRTPKEVLCKYVRNKWVPAEYPASIQRVQEWTPDECIPEFYTDPTVFKSIHEDLPDLDIPSWASCVEDFITKHREALESAHVSENLHHWIDITFGYKVSGPAAVKAKNVCLSLVDGHTRISRGHVVQLFRAPHPARAPRPLLAAPPRLYWTAPTAHKKNMKIESSEDLSDEDDESTSLPQHVSRLSVPSKRLRSKHKSNRARSLSKSQGNEDPVATSEGRASSHSRHYRVQKSELGKGIIYLPKEFNPIASIQALESIDNFRTKCFFSKAEDDKLKTDSSNLINPMQANTKKLKDDKISDNAFTNHMFQASYDQSYLRKFSHDTSHLDIVLKERKSRAFNTRYTTDVSVYKQFISEDRKQDMLVTGCLIVEIFLHTYMRPLRTTSDKVIDRYNVCRTVLKYNWSSLPKCVSYVASLLLDVQPPSLSFTNVFKNNEKGDPRKVLITDKGLPPPTPSQLLQPLLRQHLIPFPPTFDTLYSLLSILHEYEVASTELNILYTYECDGDQCEKYQAIDKTRLNFSQKIAEGKIQACVTHLDTLLVQINAYSQFDVLDIFLSHYVELLQHKDTSVLAAWYLFDTVSKALGPEESRKKLLRHILNLYDDDENFVDKSDKTNPNESFNINNGSSGRQKFVKLYHNIFLLQLMVRMGMQCFLDNFTQHLVEAVGGYKDSANEAGTPGHNCRKRAMWIKKPRYSDDNLKSVLSTAQDIFSPDTSYGSEHVITPSIEKMTTEPLKEIDSDNRSENDLFHFEADKERLHSRSSRSKSPAESIDSYTLSGNQEHEVLASPESKETLSPSKETTFQKENDVQIEHKKVLSPTKTPAPSTSMFTSYLHFADDDVKEADEVELRKESHSRQTRSFDMGRDAGVSTKNFDEASNTKVDNSYTISEMSAESLLWLAHRLGPVLTCRYITRNLLKMLTLCYIGKENLMLCEGDHEIVDDFDSISIINSRVVGDKNAIKVIRCLSSIVGMYGEQLIIFQYLPHAGELIASCRRRLTSPLEGGVVACLQLFKYIIPNMSDVKLMEQLQDAFLKSIIHPALRLVSTTRCAFPHGVVARTALAHKLLDAIHVLAVRIGPEMTRRHLAVPALQRFFLTFDKATGKIENWPKQESEMGVEAKERTESKVEGFVEICRDGSTAEWSVRDGQFVRDDVPDLACTPPPLSTPDVAQCAMPTAQEELLAVFNPELAFRAYTPFARLVGVDTMERTLKNVDNIQALCQKYDRSHALSPPLTIKSPDKRFQSSFSDEPLNKSVDKHKSDTPHVSSSNSFGSNVTLVGNRIDVASDAAEVSSYGDSEAFRVVAYNADNGFRSDRHLRGDWLIYWEHEIGRPDKDNRFNLKQIKLQTFVGHTHSIKSIYCLDNECSFMSGSKDKTVKLWSLRNQGDGNSTSQCNWTYTGHKKGVISLTFIESLRLAVSTDSVVHIWDPFMESVVSQLEHIRAPVSVVRALPGPSPLLLAATTDNALKIIDTRQPHCNHDLKLPSGATTFVRCMCVSPGGRWAACGLASGHVVAFETRTTQPLAYWRAHDSEVLRLAAVDEYRILSSGLDQTTALWKIDDGELIAHLKGPTEPVHCLSVYHNELISGTTNNRIGVHTALDQDASFSSTKLRSDTFKGILTSMAVLPLNRLLLLGSDNGTISLLC